MLTIARWITQLNLFIGRLLAWLIVPIFVLLLADVLMRYAFDRPAIWTSELAMLVFGVYAVMGGGFLLAERGHVNVDILYGNFSVRRKAQVDVWTSVLFFLFLGVLLHQGSSLAYESMEGWERSESAWRPYIWPIKLCIPMAGLLLLLQGFVRLWADVRVLRGLPVDEATFGKPAAEPGAGH